MFSQFKVLSLSHHSTSLDVRERFSLKEAEVEGFLLKIREVLGIGDCMVLSTCNRTELYFQGTIDQGLQLLQLLFVE